MYRIKVGGLRTRASACRLYGASSFYFNSKSYSRHFLGELKGEGVGIGGKRRKRVTYAAKRARASSICIAPTLRQPWSGPPDDNERDGITMATEEIPGEVAGATRRGPNFERWDNGDFPMRVFATEHREETPDEMLKVHRGHALPVAHMLEEWMGTFFRPATVDELKVDARVPDAVPKSINFRRVDDTDSRDTINMLILSEANVHETTSVVTPSDYGGPQRNELSEFSNIPWIPVSTAGVQWITSDGRAVSGGIWWMAPGIQRTAPPVAGGGGEGRLKRSLREYKNPKTDPKYSDFKSQLGGAMGSPLAGLILLGRLGFDKDSWTIERSKPQTSGRVRD
ncbi:hypothetical protein B0H13DRAFT_1897734 [Mycena leptocephala]|nr:hypothetical protein B0H13DRAFT_1897734 [Mycena leptocephala]